MAVNTRVARTAMIILLIGLMLGSATAIAEERYAALVVDVNSGRALFEKYSDDRRHPASLTKMMTLYMVFEALENGRLSLKQALPVSSRAAEQPPTKLGLKAGETLTVEQAILALVTRSANDVATVVAEALGGTEWQFARAMTARAHSLGMGDTQFRNASGLHHAEQVTTAWDMYRLARALQVHFPRYYRYFSTQRFHYRTASYRNHNKLLTDYHGTDGIKTGYIRASGFNLAASVRRGNHHLIGIVFGGRSSRSRNAHMEAILDQGFARLQREPTAPQVRLASVSRPRMTAPSAGDLLQLQLGQGSRDRPGSWTVQVGAFRERATAERQLRQAARSLPGLLNNGRASVEALERNGGRLYRARFQGFDEGEARTACARLLLLQIDCVPAQLP